MFRALLIAMPLLGIASLAQGQIPCRYELAATIQGPNCQFGPAGLTPTAISPNGMYVTGWYGQCDVGSEAFLWIGPPPGIRTTIPRPPGVGTAVGVDVNDNGTVVGWWRQSYDNGNPRGFIYHYASGTWTTIMPTPPGDWCEPTALNNAGTIVGYRSLAANQFPREAVIWTSNGSNAQGLGVMNGPSSGATAISENGIVVGWTGSQPGAFFNDTRAFVWQDGVVAVLGPVPAGISSMAYGVNSSGRVVIQGKLQSAPLILYGSYVYIAGAMSPLPVPSGFDWTSLVANSDTEMLIGACGTYVENRSHACIWLQNQSAAPESLVSKSQWNTALPSWAAGASNNGDIVIAGRQIPSLAVGFFLRPSPVLPGDANCDQHVNVDDLLNVIGSWGPCQSCSTDFDQNGLVNIDDLLTVILNWLP